MRAGVGGNETAGWVHGRDRMRYFPGGALQTRKSNRLHACLGVSSSAAVWRRVCLKVRMWVAVLRYVSRYIGGLEKWVSASLLVPSQCLSCSALVYFLPSLNISPSLFYSQVEPRIKTKHLRLSTPLAAAWIWVKPAKPVINALFPLLSESFLLVA